MTLYMEPGRGRALEHSHTKYRIYPETWATSMIGSKYLTCGFAYGKRNVNVVRTDNDSNVGRSYRNNQTCFRGNVTKIPHNYW